VARLSYGLKANTMPKSLTPNTYCAYMYRAELVGSPYMLECSVVDLLPNP